MIGRMLIIGPGLIGASAALAAKKCGLVRETVGFSRRKETLEEARRVGALDRFETDLARAAEGADFVLVCTPVSNIAARVREVAPLAPRAVITDVGSVKGPVASELSRDAALAARFVPGHPIAGTEASGPGAARADLFEGRRCILTPVAATGSEAVKRVRSFWEGIGMKVEELSPERHDEVLAMISHLPHLVAYALVGAVGEYDRKEHPALAFTAGGFKDFTRIAASSPDMWRQIIEQNASFSLKALEIFSARLEEIRRAIAEKRWGDLEKLFDAAAQVRRGLDKEKAS